MAIKIRQIDQRDEALVKRVVHLLATEIYEEESQRGMRHRWISDHLKGHPWTQAFAAFEDRKLVGAIVWSVSDISEDQVALDLYWVAVSEDRQKKGIGARLVRETINRFLEGPIFKGYGLTSVLVIGTEDNKGFWEKTLKPYATRIDEGVWKAYEGLDQNQVWFWARPEDIQAT